MLAFEEALTKVLAGVTPVATERVALENALGRVLAEDLHARAPLPAFDYSAMDGYAVRAADFGAAGPWRLPVRGESRTGGAAPELSAGCACRIFTGAELPSGADSVVMQEDVERDADTATFTHAPSRGSNVRRRGEDLEEGAIALQMGRRLGPFQLGLLAALDRAHVLVFRKPRVAIVGTGDELRAPGDPARSGSVPDSNGFMIAAMATQLGATVSRSANAPDDAGATRELFAGALTGTDLLVTIGGVSVGDHDLVRPVLAGLGAALDFWKVRIRPGKPLLFGRLGSSKILGLPGNPVSAAVTFALFGAPLVRALGGQKGSEPPLRKLTLGAALHQKPGRRSYYRALVDGDSVKPMANQASGAPTSMAWADALVIVPEGSSGYEAGATVDVLMLSEL